jgi:serine/threonine-protein kinase
MGQVWRARDEQLHRIVALKILPSELAHDPGRRTRFEQEARVLAALNHPNIVAVYEFGEDNGQTFLVSELVDGESLRALMDRGRVPTRRAIEIGAQIADAMAAAHAAGIVHRDLKPENIMVDADDNIKLIDFGIAGDAAARRLTYAKITTALGSPNYISPEQVKGKRGDGRSDIYAMGIILYEMLTGKVPFTGATPMQVINDRLLNYPTPPSVLEPSISPQLQEVIYRAMERDPANRYPRASEFANDLKHLDQVGVENRAELQEWKKRKSYLPRKIAYYAALALIPVAILLFMVLLSRR